MEEKFGMIPAFRIFYTANTTKLAIHGAMTFLEVAEKVMITIDELNAELYFRQLDEQVAIDAFLQVGIKCERQNGMWRAMQRTLENI